MSFPDTDPLLAAGTIYGPDRFAELRSWFLNLIQEEVPGWLQATEPSVIRDLWKRDDVQAGLELASLAEVLGIGSTAVTGAEDLNILTLKLKDLLSHRSSDAVTDLRAELDFLAGSSTIAGSAITMEPYNRPYSHNAATTSPDFAWHLGRARLDVEVTVVHWQPILDSDRQADLLGRYLSATLGARQVSRRIRLDVDLGARAVHALQKKSIVQQIASEPEGLIQAGGCRLEWSSSPAIQIGNLEIVLSPELAVVHDVTFERSVRLAESDLAGLKEQVIKKIDAKKPQLAMGQPALLVLGDATQFTSEKLVSELLTGRVWPNPNFNWLTAVALMLPNRQYNTGRLPGRMAFFINPRASRPLPAPFLQAIESRPQPEIPTFDMFGPGVNATAAGVWQGIVKVRDPLEGQGDQPPAD